MEKSGLEHRDDVQKGAQRQDKIPPIAEAQSSTSSFFDFGQGYFYSI